MSTLLKWEDLIKDYYTAENHLIGFPRELFSIFHGNWMYEVSHCPNFKGSKNCPTKEKHILSMNKLMESHGYFLQDIQEFGGFHARGTGKHVELAFSQFDVQEVRFDVYTNCSRANNEKAKLLFFNILMNELSISKEIGDVLTLNPHLKSKITKNLDYYTTLFWVSPERDTTK